MPKKRIVAVGKPINYRTITILLIVIAFLIGSLTGFSLYPALNAHNRNTGNSSQAKSTPLMTSSSVVTTPFCKDYGTYEIKSTDLSFPYPPVEGVTGYARTMGNIKYNPTRPVFGVNSLNGGTGPFPIPESLPTMHSNFLNGSCVTVTYALRGYSGQFLVLDVVNQ